MKKNLLILLCLLTFFSCDDDSSENTKTRIGFDQKTIKLELTEDLWCTPVEIDVCDQNDVCESSEEILQLDLFEDTTFTFTYIGFPGSISRGNWNLDDANNFTLITDGDRVSAVLRMNNLSEFDLLDQQGKIALRFYECNDLSVEEESLESLFYIRNNQTLPL